MLYSCFGLGFFFPKMGIYGMFMSMPSNIFQWKHCFFFTVSVVDLVVVVPQ